MGRKIYGRAQEEDLSEVHGGRTRTLGITLSRRNDGRLKLRFFGSNKRRPPDLRKLGQWLWNNDVALLQQQLTQATTFLFKELVESGIAATASGETFTEDEATMIAGHLTNLLDGGFLLVGYAPKSSDPRLLSAATTARNLILTGEYPELIALSVYVATLLAIHLWYEQRFDECAAVATEAMLRPTDKPPGEACRVRSFAYFAKGDYNAALNDLEEARRREPGLVGLVEPMKVLAALTDRKVDPNKKSELSGIRSARDTLGIFEKILKVAAVKTSGVALPHHELYDFSGMAREAEKLVKSNAFAKRQITMGDVIDLTKVAMSAQVAMMEHLLADASLRREELPPFAQIREAFGMSLVFLSGTGAINPNVDPAFAGIVQGFEEGVTTLLMELEKRKFDLR